MTSDDLKAQAKKHGPLVAVGLVAAVSLLRPTSPTATSSPTTSPTLGAASGSAVPTQAHRDPHVVTRIVSCGDMRGEHGAYVYGESELRSATDEHGTIRLGPGAGGKCTLLFAATWTARPSCMVVGGRIAQLDANDLVIEGAGDRVTYDCGAAKAP